MHEERLSHIGPNSLQVRSCLGASRPRYETSKKTGLGRTTIGGSSNPMTFEDGRFWWHSQGRRCFSVLVPGLQRKAADRGVSRRAVGSVRVRRGLK